MATLLYFFLQLSALAASLPGVPLPFEPAAEGRWMIGADLPPAFAAAGVAPGWVLLSVDGRAWSTPLDAQRVVATGPARKLQLRFLTPEGETVLEVARAPLVAVAEVGLLPWPAELSRPGQRAGTTSAGRPSVRDAAGTIWELQVATGALGRAPGGGPEGPAIPELWWALSQAQWVVDRGHTIEVGDTAWARERFQSALRLSSFQGIAIEHLAVPSADGLLVLSVAFPAGSPSLPSCVPDLPETCLVAGRQVIAELLDRSGGRAEANRQLGIACDAGVHRACLDLLSLADPAISSQTEACAQGNPNACHALARARLKVEPEKPSPTLVGVLEFACAVDASGSLGERLRRLEDVGEGCMLLSAAYDRATALDRALLSLDQACVLGRADGCTEAQIRRAVAFALRTVRECEDPAVPLAASCVQLGRLLQQGPISATKLDDFEAIHRACKLGDEEGCKLLGDYVDRWGIDNPRVAAAEQELLAACRKGEERACVGGAWLLVRHDPRSDAYAEALLAFHASCEKGNAPACVAGAEQRRIGQARRVDAPDQVTMWGRACDLNSAAGWEGLGERLAKNRAEWGDAFTAYTRGCDLGQPRACTALGALVSERHGEAWPGEQPADDYLRLGCENGDPEGCFRLAEDSIPGRGEPAEPVYLLLDQSCEGDFGLGCAALAGVHIERDTSFDEEIAARYLNVACENGHYESCKVLGGMYLRGRGVERDRQRARELVQRYSVNARRRHLRFGPRLGYPSVAGGEVELVLPIPVGPALAVAASGTWLPDAGGPLMLIKGLDGPSDPPDYRYVDAGVRVYPNEKARGIYVMAAVHELRANGGELAAPLERSGVSARLGLQTQTGVFYSRVETGIGHYGLIDLHDFDEDEQGTFPLIQPTIGFSVGLALF